LPVPTASAVDTGKSMIKSRRGRLKLAHKP
jgi:hypothetical protein